MEDNWLASDVALVTGGGRGIGHAIAKSLAAQSAAVAVLARTVEEVEQTASEITAADGRALAVPCDVTDRKQVEAAISAVESGLGPITLVVNNAGTCRAVGPLGEVDPDAWWREVETHVRGAALVSHYALRRMVPRRRGRIVNIYGNLGDRDGSYSSAYAVAKASLLRLTEQTANENKDLGIVAIALHPGLVHTQMIDELASEHAGKWLPAFSQIPPERFTSEDLAGAAVTAIAQGAIDALTGRCVGAWDDFVALAESAERIALLDQRVLRLTGF
jgi:NAD(P)-dependent dehydrogenase (short-subunit alcohol dehydrogenase family)